MANDANNTGAIVLSYDDESELVSKGIFNSSYEVQVASKSNDGFELCRRGRVSWHRHGSRIGLDLVVQKDHGSNPCASMLFVDKMQAVFALLFILPLSIALWVFSLFINIYSSEPIPVSPLRIVFAFVAPCIMSQWGLRRGSLDRSGALAGLVVGFFLSVSSLCFFTSLLTFFIAGSKVTKLRKEEKRKLEDDFKEGGQRNWVQVLCNGGIATEFAIMYMLDVGCTERVIDFQHDYNVSWDSIAVLAALCCSCGDTFSSEIGAVFFRSKEPRLITSFEKVPRGTNGGVSPIGTLSSAVGGMLVGGAYFVTLLATCQSSSLETAPPQWLLIPLGAVFGLLGSTIDSFLGATMQYSGFDKKKRCIVEHPGRHIDHISGSDILDNHSVNLLASLFTALLAPSIAFITWSYCAH